MQVKRVSALWLRLGTVPMIMIRSQATPLLTNLKILFPSEPMIILVLACVRS